MQGTLNEIDIRSILQLIELGQRTGELCVESYGPGCDRTSAGNGPVWFVFFVNGRIVYATDNQGSRLGRLQDYLRRYKLEDIQAIAPHLHSTTTNIPEYAYLWELLENHHLTTQQAKEIIHGLIEETLFDLLSLHQGSFIFEMSSALAPQLASYEVGTLVRQSITRIQAWKQLHPLIKSPEQSIRIHDKTRLMKAIPAKAFENLVHWADGQNSLRQISRHFKRDFVTIAKVIYPYIQEGLVQIQDPPKASPAVAAPTVSPSISLVCIDDDRTIGRSVEYFLSPHGYQVTAIANPLDALKEVFEIRPQLILCDIIMPDLDGYEICAMLRSSTIFRQVPLIMLTGKEGFIDRVRAKMVGATDYLTKPFGENEILMLVEKYLGAAAGR